MRRRGSEMIQITPNRVGGGLVERNGLKPVAGWFLVT